MATNNERQIKQEVALRKERLPLNWTAIATITAVVTLIAYLWLVPRANLGWAKLSQSSILAEGVANPHIKIMVDGQESSNVILMRFKIINLGNQTIRSADFDQEIVQGKCGLKLVASKNAHFLAADIEQMTPESRPPVPISLKASAILIPAFNLNAGEAFIIQVLTTSDVAIHLEGHIVGTTIEDSLARYESFRQIDKFGWPLAILFTALFGIFQSDLFPKETRTRGYAIVFVVWLITVITLIFTNFWLQLWRF